MKTNQLKIIAHQYFICWLYSVNANGQRSSSGTPFVDRGETITSTNDAEARAWLVSQLRRRPRGAICGMRLRQRRPDMPIERLEADGWREVTLAGGYVINSILDLPLPLLADIGVGGLRIEPTRRKAA